MNGEIKNVVILLLLGVLGFGSAVHADQIKNTQFFNGIAISKSVHRNGKIVQNDLIIHSYALKHDPSKSLIAEALSPVQPEYGKIIWTITPQQLPMPKDTCLWADSPLCAEYKDDFWHGECVHSCIYGGADLLAFDKKAGKLYLSASSTSIGTGGGPYFVFSADVNKKEIKFLKTEYGPFDGDLSPSGTYLLLYGGNSIGVYNTITGKEFYISEKNNWDRGHERLHGTYNIHWLSNDQFSYYDGVRHSKFQPSQDEVKENVYDIPTKKIIRTRTLAKNEYDSAPYVEPN